ncbi:hypothetical protein [Salipiger sp.]|uniref:hypothetical protein n=1 Tax=Salipiger sp. TaxID=2078585 RepID=UPI003A96DC21
MAIKDYAAVLSACVTSRGSTLSRSETGKFSADGLRVVATTSQTSSRKRLTEARGTAGDEERGTTVSPLV